MNKRLWGSIAVATAGLAIFVSSQQSFALWSDSAAVNGGVVSAATVELTTGTSSGTSSASTIAALTTGGTPIGPGATVQAPITIKNSGNDPVRWRMQSTTALQGFTLTTYSVASEAQCPAGVNTAAPATVVMPTSPADASLQYPVSPGYMPTTLAGGASEILCTRLAVTDAGGPAQTSTITFTFQAGLA